ncbi:MAG: septal ring lytic transglycosylase RlpA family protein [Alphaproteobacteria bacterium]|nr:septal ring lytic transglycosylase RlpA family protein [Alphaproteobacteria bacterium]
MNFKKLIILSTLFLIGCSVRTPVGPTHVSSKAYFCRGAWHFPQDYYEYDEIGIASWYGDDFHGKKKASGEHFNKMALTAAHKTLPIPSVVKVTSLKTGKSVIVVVDDRGPFVYKGRIIDLSYGAAKALGIHKYKPSPVRVQTLVSDSLSLSKYISYYCKKRKDPFGRTWVELYMQEIKDQKLKTYTEKSTFVHSETKNKITKNKKRKYNSLGSYLNKL